MGVLSCQAPPAAACPPPPGGALPLLAHHTKHLCGHQQWQKLTVWIMICAVRLQVHGGSTCGGERCRANLTQLLVALAQPSIAPISRHLPSQNPAPL